MTQVAKGASAPVSKIESRFIVKNGRLVEHLVRTGMGDSKAFIDQLTFVFHAATIGKLMGSRLESTESDSVLDNYAIVLSYYLEQIFGFGISEKRNKSANFYTQSYQLGDRKCSYGLVCMGGNKNTICVELTATGLGAAKDGWEQRLYQFASLPAVDSFRFTRVDVARDFFDGEYDIDAMLRDYHAGGFTLSVTRPRLRKEGLDWFNDTSKGRTLYVGSRESSRLLRGYEKGKQLGDETSRWFRLELELRSRDLIIPPDILLNPGDYLATYPALQTDLITSRQPQPLAVKQRQAQSGIEHAIKYLRMQGSRAVNLLLKHGKSAEEILTVFDPDAGVPDTLHPGRYFCQLLGIQYIHRAPDVIPV